MEIKKCPECGLNNDTAVEACERCGYSFSPKAEDKPAPVLAPIEDRELFSNVTEESGLLFTIKSFFAFRLLLSRHLIPTIYAIGALLLTLYSADQIVAGIMQIRALNEEPKNLQDFVGAVAVIQIFFGALLITFGNLAWRLICEVWKLLFNAYDRLISIDEKL